MLCGPFFFFFFFFCLWYPIHNITNVPRSSTSVEDVRKGLWNVHRRQHSVDKKRGLWNSSHWRCSLKGKTSGALKRCPFPPPLPTFFLYVNPRSPRVPVFSARYLYVEPLYYGQILFNVLVGGRTAGAEIKMRKQSAPAVEVLIQKLTTVCWLIAFCLMCFQKPWFLFSVTQSQLRRDIKRPVKLKIPFKGAALPPPSSSTTTATDSSHGSAVIMDSCVE